MRLKCCWCLALLTFLVSPVLAQVPDAVDRPTLRLPPALPDGRPLRPIALFLSQMDELIPDDYRPISMEQLNEAITRLTDRATDDKTSRLKNAVYWVEVIDDTLVSNRSVIDIESDRPTEVRRSLGKVNLAIEPPQVRANELSLSAIPRLETEADGNLVAVFRGDAAAGSPIEFRWKLNGQLFGTGHEFTMQLPRTPQTRIVLSAPDTTKVEALDGVLRSRPGPPPDADDLATNRNLRWYEIDAGGLSQVRLRTHQQRAMTDRGSFVVRRSSVQYEVDPGGLTWTSRMVVQPQSDLQLPPLQIAGTTVTSVKVNATDVPYTSKIINGQVQQLQLQMPAGLSGSETIAMSVTMTGYSTWSSELGWCDLPKPIWIGEDIVQASAVNEVQLAVLDPLRVMSWQLPPQWKQSQQQRLENGVTLLSADGPPIGEVRPSQQSEGRSNPVNALADEQASEEPRPESRSTNRDTPEASSTGAFPAPWSRVRLTKVPDLIASDTLLRLEVGSGLLTAKARLAVTLDPSRVEPMRLQLEAPWSLDSVTFARSGRVVEHAGVSEQSPSLDLWPEAEDADGGRIVIEVTGTRGIPAVTGGLTVPSTWFVRIADVRGRMLTAIVPPADLDWSGEAAMERGRIKAPKLTTEQQQFFGVMSPETLWFQPDTARTPPVLLQTPSVSYNAATVLQLRVEDGDLVEQLMVVVESQSQSLKQLVFHTGPADGRPDLAWSIAASEEGPAINLPSSDVTVGRGEDDGVYTIDVSDTNLRSRHLIARRRYPVKNQFQLQLPSVPGAASQDSDVLIDADLMVLDRPRAVQLVPLSPRDLVRGLPGLTSTSSSATNSTTATTTDSTAVDPLAGRGWTRLRYDAVEQPAITLSTIDSDPDVTIVWREQVRVIASSRGTDRVEATYTVSPTAPFRIESDPTLQLASVLRDGVPVDLTTLPQHPIVLQPRFKTEVIQVAWDRSQFGSGWVRRCRIPNLRVSGTVLRSEYFLDSSSDSFTPAALLAGNSGGGNAVRMRPGDSTLLLRRNTALAVGWLFAIVVFALGWYIAERAPVAVAALLVVATAVLFLWWPWRMAVIGWLIVPLVAAGTLSTSRAWGRAVDWSKDWSRRGDRVDKPLPAAETAPGELSVKAMVKPMVLWTIVFLGAEVASNAQETMSRATLNRDTAVNVLVPVKETGELSGDMVYIPQSVFVELFRSSSSNVPKEVRFQSAKYRVRISPSNSSGDQPVVASVEAEYQIHLAGGDQNASLVRLPLASDTLRRLERIDDVARIVPFEADSTGQVVASLPRGNAFTIRATLRPMVTQSAQWNSLYLAIPPVASSQLTVESEQNLDAIRLGGPSGRLLSEESEQLRRWEEEIGPARSLEIDVRVNEGGAGSDARALGRRYWIHAGKRQVTIDCEVDPPNAVAAGEAFQFVVRDSVMPNVVSSAWRFKGSELYSPTRRLITLESTRDSPGPIRLLWTQPLQLNRREQSLSVPIRIPEVIAAALGENSDAWIALHCDTSLQFAPLIGESIEPLSVDQFLAAWTGYRGRIDRAFVSIGEIPSPVLEFKTSSRPKIDQSHHLHVLPDSLELFYSATLTPSDSNRTLYRLQVPQSLELTRISVNGVELVEQPLTAGDSGEWLLGDFVGSEPVKVEVVAIQSLQPKVPFTPPRLSILPDAPTVDQYRISRDRATKLKVVKDPIVEPLQSNELAMADSLAKGWIPVSTWSTRRDHSPKVGEDPGGSLEAQSQPTRFDCEQLIVLTRQDSQWLMETFVRFGRRVPDFVDIEVPASWCESLEVSPITALSRQQAIDPSRQVIRIRCDKAGLIENVLSIRGQLVSTETGRVSVPSVRVLGFGQRRIHISVPNRLANESVQWRTSAVEGDSLPQQWTDIAGHPSHSTYVVANPSWSIDLAPLPEVDAEALAVSSDAQAFPQEDGVLVMCHWDLFPGSLDAIDVRLPKGAKSMGAWSAGKSVVTEPVINESANEPGQNLLRIPLALSRLSQPIELLIRVPSAAAKQASYLPELIGIPVTESWLTNYVPADDRQSIWGETSQPSGERALALGSAVLDAMDAVEFINQRPRDEVVTWLRLWIARYEMIAESVGHQTLFERNTPADDSGTAAVQLLDSAEGEARLTLPSQLRWDELDARIAVYVERFLIDLPIRPSEDWNQDVFLFGVADFDGFVPGWVSRPSDSDPPRAVQPALYGDRGLRSLIVNALTLILIGGLLICLRPLQRIVAPLANHPAFWLGLMGVFGFAVAPVPVAAALILVAVSLPVFPRRSRSSSPAVR